MNPTWRPKNGLSGDVNPFFWKGEYHAFYLESSGISDPVLRFRTMWAHLVSSDLIHWDEYPIALKPGPKGSPDGTAIWTGSVIEHDGLFHIFYTGYNREDLFHSQTICHATSKDLVKWEKDQNNPVLKADPNKYETHDWRDPKVFWNKQTNKFCMLLTARRKIGSEPFIKRGCIVLATSEDLFHWRVDSDFWCPNLCFCHECPDIFQWDNKWYLIWSKFAKPMGTFYRIADDLRGPWHTPPADRLDGKYLYAIRTAGDNFRRLAFGWVPTRLGEWDVGYWEWGGDLAIPREVVKNIDGTLGFKCPPEIIKNYTKFLPVNLNVHLGTWKKQEDSVIGDRVDGLGYCFVPFESDNFVFETSLTLKPGTANAGILFKTELDFSQGYMVRFDPVYRRVVIDHWPLPADIPWQSTVIPPGLPSNNEPSPLVEQPIDITYEQPIDCKIIISKSIIQVFVNEKVSLTYRVYKTTGIPIGLFVEGGSVQFINLKLKEI